MKTLIISILSLVISISGALACSCAEWGSAKEMLRNADAAYLVIPTENSQSISTSVFGPEFFSPQKTGMKVIKRYKGKYKKFFYLFSEKDTGANCGASFKKATGLFLIFAYKQNGRYVSTGCDLSVVHPEIDHVNRLISEL